MISDDKKKVVITLTAQITEFVSPEICDSINKDHLKDGAIAMFRAEISEDATVDIGELKIEVNGVEL